MQRNHRQAGTALLRGAILAGSIACLVLPARGARRVTAAQVEETLAADDATHRADADAARQIGEFEMTERLTERTLNRFAAAHKLGPRTALALELLADQSAFLDPPAGELPATAPPDAAEQKQILDAARVYSAQTWARLPNFFVTRVTNRFDDGPHVLSKGSWPVRAGLQPVGSSNRQVTFRDGKEVQDSAETAATQKTQSDAGLSTWGEFGPALLVVLSDATNGKIAFSHWEEIESPHASGKNAASSPLALVAVFHYSVPRAASHYQVNYCCVLNAKSIGSARVNYGNREQGPSPYAHNAIDVHTFVETPGYQGTISIDPATGTVLRITIEAELSRDDPLMKATSVIEYGRVQIGDAFYVGPLRSVAISLEEASAANLRASALSGQNQSAGPAWTSPSIRVSENPILLVNETRFVAYHRLGSTARILTDAASTRPDTQPGAQSGAPETNSPAGTAGAPAVASAEPAATNSAPAQTPTQPEARQADATITTAAAAPIAPPAPPPQPVIPEVSMTAANGVPDRPSNVAETPGEGYALKVTSRLVDVGLVAYDKKGHPVTDLKESDLEVYDNGHKEEIRSFGIATANPTQPQSAATTASADSDEEEPAFANRATDAPGATSPASEIGSTILLIDESHIAWSDMNYARGQILKFLNSLQPGERVGLYAMTGLGFRALVEVTTDHAALIARMQKFMASAQSVAQAQEEETRNRQHFDEVHNAADLNSVNGNHTDAPDAEQPVDPQLLTMGDNPARASFIILAQVARHLASLPGHKKLVWVSSDNVLADWQDQAVGIDKSPKEVISFALRAQEAMNDAHTAVYPFDVSQLEVGGVGADLQHSSVQLTPAASENAATAASAGAGAQGSAANRDISPGRIDATMSQDLHPVQGPVRQFASGTGGRVIRRSGDLASQLDGIVADGHATYMLSFSPQGQADGQYHTINIKLSGRHGLTLSYRAGYVFEKEAATLKDRFQQAVWRPIDVSEIAVTANVDAASDGANVKINIATGDLGLQEQAGRWMDKLDIFFVQRDDTGLHARVEGQSLGLNLKSSTYQKLMPKGIPFERFVAAKPGIGSLRVVVVDENSGRMGSITIPASAMAGGQ